MAKKPRLYRRLTRATTSVGAYRSLWLGPDHVLVVTSTGYTEEYRRILFSNIQGMFTVESSRRTTCALIWGGVAAVGGIIAVTNYTQNQTPIASTIFAGIGCLGLLWNHLLGPSCKVYVLTGVQTLQLPSLVRWRKARRVIAQLEPFIAEAQQALPTVPPASVTVAEPPPLP